MKVERGAKKRSLLIMIKNQRDMINSKYYGKDMKNTSATICRGIYCSECFFGTSKEECKMDWSSVQTDMEIDLVGIYIDKYGEVSLIEELL